MDEIVISSNFTLGKVSINYAEILTAVKAKTAHYASVIVTEDSIPEFKQALADLRKLDASLNADRIAIKKTWNEPVNEMELNLKPIFAVIAESAKNLDDQLKEYEAKRSQTAREALQALFNASPIKDITFDKILKPAWLLKGSEGKAEKLLQTEMERITGDLAFIEATEDKAEAVLTKENYLNTLDLLTAQSQARQTLTQVRRAEALRRQSDELIAQNSARLEAEAKAKITAVQPTYQRDTFAESFEPVNLFETQTKKDQEPKPMKFLLQFDDMFEYASAIELLDNAKIGYTKL